ncbi:hypothetical protein ACFL6S_30880 [Candidatus Poribacteria bacterium]
MYIQRSIKSMINGAAILFALGILVSSSYARIEPDAVVGVWLLDENADDAIVDSSVNGHDGEFFGKAIWDKGKFGNALQFNGSTDYGKINAQLINPEEGTVVLWLNADDPVRDDGYHADRCNDIR